MLRLAKRKTASPVRSDEENRLAILRFLYDAHRKAGTIEGSKFQIRELKADLKKLGLQPAEIARNLDYLVQNDWILKETEPYVMNRGRRMISSKRVTYRISSRGIDIFQGPSQFQRPGSPFGISIVQNAPGIVQVGPYNYVNVAFRDLYQSLESLAQAILTSDKILPRSKLRNLRISELCRRSFRNRFRTRRSSKSFGLLYKRLGRSAHLPLLLSASPI